MDVVGWVLIILASIAVLFIVIFGLVVVAFAWLEAHENKLEDIYNALVERFREKPEKKERL